MRRILLALAIGLALVALPGVGFAASDEETVRVLQRDADQGNAAARNNLGVLYRDAVAASARTTARLCGYSS